MMGLVQKRHHSDVVVSKVSQVDASYVKSVKDALANIQPKKKQSKPQVQQKEAKKEEDILEIE